MIRIKGCVDDPQRPRGGLRNRQGDRIRLGLNKKKNQEKTIMKIQILGPAERDLEEDVVVVFAILDCRRSPIRARERLRDA